MKKFIFIPLLFAASFLHASPGLIFLGFEPGDTNETFTTLGTLSVETTTVHAGKYALETNPVGSAVGTVAIGTLNTAGGEVRTAAVTNAFFRTWFYVKTLPASGNEEFVICVATDVSFKFSIRLNSIGNLVFVDTNTVAIATGPSTIALNTWYILKVNVGTGATTGPWECLLNGVRESSGIANIGALATGSWDVGKAINRNSQSVDYVWDDIYFSSDAYPNNGQCQILTPLSIGTTNAWLENAGSSVALSTDVNEVPNDGDTSYIRATAVGNEVLFKDTLTFGTRIFGSVNAVSEVIIDKRDGSVGGQFQPEINSGGVTLKTASNSNSVASYQAHILMANTDPGTSLNWATNALNSIQSGVVNQSTNSTRVSAVYTMVDFIPSPIYTIIH